MNSSEHSSEESALERILIEPTVQYLNNIEKSVFDGSSIPYNLGKATRPHILPSGVERPLHVRAWRAEQYDRLTGGMRARIVRLLFGGKRPVQSKEIRKDIHDEAIVRDDLAEDFLKQGRITFISPEYGEISAAFTRLDPPEKNDMPPIVLVPGIANDLASVPTLAQELAKKRTTIVIGQPESQMGSVTEKFAETVEASDDYSPHARFFSEAISHLVPENEKVELWGFSAGGPIVARMLHDPTFNHRVSDATLVNPSASTAIPESRTIKKFLGKIIAWPFDGINQGIVRDTVAMLTSRIPSILVYGRKSSEPTGQRALKERTFQAVLGKLRTPFEGFNTMHLENGRKIAVVTSTGDYMTRSAMRFRTDKSPAGAVVLERKGVHNTPMLYPEELVKDVEAIDRGTVMQAD